MKSTRNQMRRFHPFSVCSRSNIMLPIPTGPALATGTWLIAVTVAVAAGEFAKPSLTTSRMS